MISSSDLRLLREVADLDRTSIDSAIPLRTRRCPVGNHPLVIDQGFTPSARDLRLLEEVADLEPLFIQQ